MTMFRRTYAVGPVESAADLAAKLTEQTWCLCTGFRHAGYLYLNDATCEDGAGEWAVIEETTMRQVESITFGWMTAARATEYIAATTAGLLDAGGYAFEVVAPDRIQALDEHGTCRYCA